MSRRIAINFGLLIASCVLLAAVDMRRLKAAEATFDSASGQLVAATNDVREILKLRRQSQRAEDQRRPEQDLIARVHGVMADAGLPVQEHFKSLRGEADQSLPGNSRYRQQTVSLSMQSIQPRQLGALLDAWINTQPAWTIARIELVHERDRKELDVYAVVVTFTAIYVADAASASRT